MMTNPTDTIPSAILSAVATFAFLWLFYPAWAVLIADHLEWDVEEMTLSDAQTSEPPLLSLVIPAYNEQDRIPIMIRETFDYLASQRGEKLLQKLQSCAESKTTSSHDDEPTNNTLSSKEKIRNGGSKPKVEWIIVNDGSTDETCDTVRKTYEELMAGKVTVNVENKSFVASAYDWKWKLVSLKRNAGKGGAVKTGMNLAQGMFQLMVDADGATEFGYGLENLTRELEAHTLGMVKPSAENGGSRKDSSEPMIALFGSRAHLEKGSTAERSFVRTLLMKAFHFFVSLFVSTKVHDTQCGFKLFTKAASCAIFQTLHLRRWAFDTEIVLLCDRVSIDVIEVAVRWKEIDGSKLSTSKLALAIVSISMLRDMICVRSCYTLGIWRVNMSYLRK